MVGWVGEEEEAVNFFFRPRHEPIFAPVPFSPSAFSLLFLGMLGVAGRRESRKEREGSTTKSTEKRLNSVSE